LITDLIVFKKTVLLCLKTKNLNNQSIRYIVLQYYEKIARRVEEQRNRAEEERERELTRRFEQEKEQALAEQWQQCER